MVLFFHLATSQCPGKYPLTCIAARRWWSVMGSQYKTTFRTSGCGELGKDFHSGVKCWEKQDRSRSNSKQSLYRKTLNETTFWRSKSNTSTFLQVFKLKSQWNALLITVMWLVKDLASLSAINFAPLKSNLKNSLQIFSQSPISLFPCCYPCIPPR